MYMYIKYSSNYFKYSILVKIFENKEGYVRATLGSLRGWVVGEPRFPYFMKKNDYIY
jgi:hypothetical protein